MARQQVSARIRTVSRENVTGYDKNGNIKSLQRYGQTGASAYGLIDNLTFTLNGNQLSRVDDAVSTVAYGTNSCAFVNGAKRRRGVLPTMPMVI